MSNRRQFPCWLLAPVIAGLAAAPIYGAATITILNTDAAGVGFNDPTPAAPVGGNTGTTIGQQRLNVFQHAASIWGANLNSAVPIRIDASWPALSCNATAAVLGSAGTTSVFSFTSGSGVFLNTWYPKALVNKLVGIDVNPSVPDIRAQFNVNLGKTGCLEGIFFYLGLDNNHGSNLDLATVLLHEFAHGLGFQNFTAQNGALLGAPTTPRPGVFNKFQLDLATNLMWDAMTDAQRAASTINPRKVVWTGTNVTSDVSSVLVPGTPQLTISAPVSVAGTYVVGGATFGPAMTGAGITGEVMPVAASPSAAAAACSPLSSADAAAINGKIALIDRGTCGFPIKVKNAQDAGATGVIIANNVAGAAPLDLGGSDPTITIPTVHISQADGAALKDVLKFRSRTHSGMTANMFANQAIRRGADALGRALLYTPNPYEGGSSVSHWDISAFKNLLMEPSYNLDLTHSVSAPADLTLQLLRDIGWN